MCIKQLEQVVDLQWLARAGGCIIKDKEAQSNVLLNSKQALIYINSF